jgi:hypothetical protein
MTIVSVRFYFKPKNKRRELALSRNLWGFAEWFPRRLKPIREQLRGVEAKGVDIVNFMLYENPEQVLQYGMRLDEWHKILNSFNFNSTYDLASLVKRDRVKSIRELMRYGSEIALAAPWPQVVAVGKVMAAPLNELEEEQILPFLRWPREIRY